jgi:hypothetical protein
MSNYGKDGEGFELFSCIKHGEYANYKEVCTRCQKEAKK